MQGARREEHKEEELPSMLNSGSSAPKKLNIASKTNRSIYALKCQCRRDRFACLFRVFFGDLSFHPLFFVPSACALSFFARFSIFLSVFFFVSLPSILFLSFYFLFFKRLRCPVGVWIFPSIFLPYMREVSAAVSFYIPDI
jgi:hypothetical protein